jgi:uncharacterized protein YbjT (DUF2867 family)
MADKKIIAVMGATGSQGSGLIQAILDDPNGGFQARAITRDVNSDKAKALAQKGVEVVAADLDDEASIKRAFTGAYGAYCVTFFWNHFSPDKEGVHAKAMAAAAKQAGVKHVIWSTLEDTRKLVPLSDDRMPTLQGKYKCPHFDSKGESDHFFTDAGLPVTFLLTTFYWDNMIYFGMGPKKGQDGTLGITFPIGDKRMSGMASEDIGKIAYGIFKKGDQYIGKRVSVAGEHITGKQMAASLSKALGKEVRYNDVSPDAYRKFGFPGAEDLGNMFQYYRDFESQFVGARDLNVARSLNPALQSFDQWLAKNKSRIPLD